METEKVCVNLSAAEIGKIDILVAQGLFTNRSDVVRQALAAQFERHDRAISDVVRRATAVGLAVVSSEALRRAADKGERLSFRVVGILSIAGSVTPELALDTIDEVRILGTVRGPTEVVRALESEDRIHHGAL